jgi:hypothetical protein
MKRFFIISLLLLSAGIISAQNEKKEFAIELNTEIMYDDADKIFNNWGDFKGRYETKRERISIGALYGLTPCLKMKTTLGISTYTSQLMLRPFSASDYTKLTLNNVSLLLGQKVLYDVIRWHYWQVGVKVSPFLGIAYEHFLDKNKGAMGFLDLENKKELQDRFKSGQTCVIGGTSKLPAGLFAISTGLSTELTINRFGIFYDLGYSYSTGHSRFDTKFVFTDGVIHTLNVQSKDRGLTHALGLRCYF